MSNIANLNPAHFLTRLPLEEMTDASSINPIKSLKVLFDYAGQDELKDMLNEYCGAALSIECFFIDGHPCDMLFIHKKLELLLEACFLIHARKNELAVLSSKGMNAEIGNDFLAGISSNEKCIKPLQIIDKFFLIKSLPEWKRMLNKWLEASLADYSLIDTVDGRDIMEAYMHLERLIEAGSLLCELAYPNPGNMQL